MSTEEKVAQKFLHKEGVFQIEAMSNLRSKTTGVVGVVIWISAGEFSGSDLQHGPRIKVVLGDKINKEGLKNAVSVTIAASPKVIGVLPARIKKEVLAFINNNRDTLLAHWNGELDASEAIAQLNKVE